MGSGTRRSDLAPALREALAASSFSLGPHLRRSTTLAWRSLCRSRSHCCLAPWRRSELGTGAASLYRYVATREDLLDLMTDETATEFDLPAPSGDWRADLLSIARQARDIMRRHPWVPALTITRPVLGPHGADLLEHVLDILADHPAGPERKLEAFALLNALTALFAQNEQAAADTDAHRRLAYLGHVAAAGTHPRITAVLASLTGSEPHDQFDETILRTLSGVLG